MMRLAAMIVLTVIPSMATACAPSKHAMSAGPPDVVFIICDDLNADLTQVHTPNIDRLAARGMRFDHAYCQYPLCNPSRASLLSGLRPQTTGIFDNDTPPWTHLKNVTPFPEYFHVNGYFTARVGKIAHSKYEDSVKWDLVRKGTSASPTGEEEVPYS